jgi:succinate dehydrogenase/fumarate reductase cytochrome b subunit
VAATSDRLLRVQAVSGLVFLAFVLVHDVNTMAAVAGEQAYDGYQASARSVYQWPGVELLLVFAPLLVHVVAGVLRLKANGFRRGGASLRQRLHRYTGWFLLAVIVGHVVAVRGASLLFDVFPGFAGLSFSIWWVPWMFYPYYLLLGWCGWFHGLNGLCIALRVLGRRAPGWLRDDRSFAVLMSVSGVVFLLAVLAIGRHDDPTDNDYARLWEREVGVSLEK